MARIRTIKPEFFLDYELAQLEPEIRLFFIGLWLHADKEGRLKDEPERLQVQILPWGKFKAEECLKALNPKFITRYKGIDDKKYIQVNAWHHQKPHHTEIESKIEPLTVNTPLNNGEKKVGREYGKEGNMERKGMEVCMGETTHTSKRFKKPALNELQNYCKQIGADIDPQRFLDFYESKGWVVGKSPMKDWRAAVRTWKQGGNYGTDKNRTGRINIEADKYARFDKPNYGK